MMDNPVVYLSQVQNLDLLKIAIIVAGIALLYLIGRWLSPAVDRREDFLVRSNGPDPAPVGDEGKWSERNGPPVAGAEIKFPIALPPVVQQFDGTYNRPEITNYFFLKTDLLQGPSDHDSFSDELHVEGRDPGNKYPLEYIYTVATLAGLKRVMEDNHLASLYLDTVVIIERWDLPLILRTVMDDIIKDYTAGEFEEDAEEEFEPGTS